MSDKELGWQRLAEKIGDKHGEAIVDALKELYEVFGHSIIEWMASLYDPEHGAWYYSKSAQATDGYLPNAESTLGAVGGFFEHMGATGGVPYENFLPDWLRKKVSDFIYGLQDPDGYFYHPQWGKNISILKKSRDLGTCKTLLRRMTGTVPKYPLPGVPKSDGTRYDLSLAPERFRSVENYENYLYRELDFETRSYSSGSQLSSQMGEVETYGKLLGVDLVDMTLSYIITKERADNGLWNAEKNYHGTNGLQKISKMYNWYNRKIPYAMKALESTMEIIMSDEPAEASTSVYNPWHALGSVMLNLKTQHGLAEAEYAEIVERVFTWAPDAIRKSAKKMSVFKKPDGGISYLVETSSPTDQRAPAAVPGSREGDVNGMGCAAAIIPSIYSALDLEAYQVPLYSLDEFKEYISLVEKIEMDYRKAHS